MKQQPRWVGRVGFAGDAVNPSLEAWPPHPCGGHSREPNPPSDSFLWPPATEERKKSNSGSRAALAHKQTNKKDAAKAASFLFSISSSATHALAHRHRETVGGGAVWVGRTVGAMGPRPASGGLGRTPNPGLAVCAGQRTRARRHRAPRGEGALLAKHCFASARTHSRQRLGRTPEGGLRRVLPTHTAPPNPQKPRAALALALASARRRRTTARQRGTSTSNPIGQLTPVPPMPQ